MNVVAMLTLILLMVFGTSVLSFMPSWPPRPKPDSEFTNYALPACNLSSSYNERCSCQHPEYNLSVIPTRTEFLQIGLNPPYSQICTPNYTLPTADPVPRLPHITRVGISSVLFTPDDPPFPIGDFLVNVKERLVFLDVTDTYVPSITRHTFAGFVALSILWLQRNRMSTVALDAFESFGPTRGSAAPNKLLDVSISGNNFETFDWSVFEPLAADVQRIDLDNNGISAIYSSRPFVMHNLLSVWLAGNHLMDVDQTFLDSLSASGFRSGLHVHYNPLCLDDEQCNCTSMETLRDYFTIPVRSFRQPHPEPRYLFYLDLSTVDLWTCGNYTILERPGFRTKFSDSTSSKTYSIDKFGQISSKKYE